MNGAYPYRLRPLAPGWSFREAVPQVRTKLPNGCISCGKDGAIQLHSGVYCGRCALLTAGDTLGTIASVVMDLGAAT